MQILISSLALLPCLALISCSPDSDGGKPRAKGVRGAIVEAGLEAGLEMGKKALESAENGALKEAVEASQENVAASQLPEVASWGFQGVTTSFSNSLTDLGRAAVFHYGTADALELGIRPGWAQGGHSPAMIELVVSGCDGGEVVGVISRQMTCREARDIASFVERNAKEYPGESSDSMHLITADGERFHMWRRKQSDVKWCLSMTIHEGTLCHYFLDLEDFAMDIRTALKSSPSTSRKTDVTREELLGYIQPPKPEGETTKYFDGPSVRSYRHWAARDLARTWKSRLGGIFGASLTQSVKVESVEVTQPDRGVFEAKVRVTWPQRTSIDSEGTRIRLLMAQRTGRKGYPRDGYWSGTAIVFKKISLSDEQAKRIQALEGEDVMVRGKVIGGSFLNAPYRARVGDHPQSVHRSLWRGYSGTAYVYVDEFVLHI